MNKHPLIYVLLVTLFSACACNAGAGTPDKSGEADVLKLFSKTDKQDDGIKPAAWEPRTRADILARHECIYPDSETIEIVSDESLKQVHAAFVRLMDKDPSVRPAHIHVVMKIQSSEDAERAGKYYREIAGVISSMELQFQKDIPNGNLDLMVESGSQCLVFSGAGEKPVNIGRTRILAYSKHILLHNLQWSRIGGNQGAVSAVFGESFTASDLVFSGEMNVPKKPAVEPGRLIELSSERTDGGLADITLENIIFEHVYASGLVTMTRKTRGKFGTMSIKNVSVIDNDTLNGGVDISVAQSVRMSNVVARGSGQMPAFIQRTSDAEVVLDHVIFGDNAYGFIQDKGQTGKPKITKNDVSDTKGSWRGLD